MFIAFTQTFENILDTCSLPNTNEFKGTQKESKILLPAKKKTEQNEINLIISYNYIIRNYMLKLFPS